MQKEIKFEKEMVITCTVVLRVRSVVGVLIGAGGMVRTVSTGGANDIV